MTSYVSQFDVFQPAAERRAAGIAVTLLVHLVLIACWYMARIAPPVQVNAVRRVIQWIDLPTLQPAPRPTPVQPEVQLKSPAAHPAAAVHADRSAPVPASTVVAPSAPAASISVVPAEPALPSAATILERARASAGGIDRALRKENHPYIVAPPDSPMIRMRSGMARAYDAVPPKLWEAPKVDELVNQTGDGARRTRVNGALGTYCITERGTSTSTEQVERDGKLRLTNCPQHEDAATQQDWRTARD